VKGKKVGPTEQNPAPLFCRAATRATADAAPSGLPAAEAPITPSFTLHSLSKNFLDKHKKTFFHSFALKTPMFHKSNVEYEEVQVFMMLFGGENHCQSNSRSFY
jgi:hypothetical protein